MSHHFDNLPHHVPGGLLDRLTADWAARGWTLDGLHGLRMEGEGAPPSAPEGTPPASGAGTPPPAPDAKFTQADLDRIAAREKEEGRRAAERATAEALGCTVEEAKKLIEEKRQADLGKMDEADRKAAEAADAKSKADAEKAKAEAAQATVAADKRRLAVKEALIDAECRKDRRDAAVTLIGDLPDVDASTEDGQKAIAAAVEECKKTYPEFFGAAPGAPSGVPSGRPPAGSGDAKTGVEAGRERARREREATNGAGDSFGGLVPLGTK